MNFYKVSSCVLQHQGQDTDHYQHPRWPLHASQSVGNHSSHFCPHRLLSPGFKLYVDKIMQNSVFIVCLLSLHILHMRVSIYYTKKYVVLFHCCMISHDINAPHFIYPLYF